MNRRALFSAALACAGVLFLLACSESKKSTGVTEGGNTGAFAGVVVDSAGKPVTNALVRLRPATYVKDVDTAVAALIKVGATIDSAQDTLPLLDAYTNQQGEYYLDSIPVGEYSIETRYVDDSNKVFVTWRSASLVELAPMELAPDTLRKPATVRGIVPDSLLALGYHYVQVIGLDRIEEVDQETGEFEIKDLPPGIFRIRFVTDDDENDPARIFDLDLDEDDEEELGEVEGEEEVSTDDEEEDVDDDSTSLEIEDSTEVEEEEEVASK